MNVVMHTTYEDGEQNNVNFQKGLAKEITAMNPDVVVGCVGNPEANVWYKVFRKQNFHPKAMFMTCAGWGWPEQVFSNADRTDVVTNSSEITSNDYAGLHPLDGLHAYAAGQWTKAMSEKSTNLAAYVDDIVGGVGGFEREYKKMDYAEDFTYDSVAAYTAVYVYMANMRNYLRSQDGAKIDPQLLNDAVEYEAIRRNLFKNRIQSTIYGPVTFDDNLQNEGRGPGNMYVDRYEGSWGVLKTTSPQG